MPTEKVHAMRLLEVCVIVMILAVLGALLVPGSDSDLTHRFPPTATDSRDDFSGVAGEYYQGAARGRYFHLSILADGRKPRTDQGPGDFYLAPPLVQVDGLPELPDQWARFLGDHVAIGKITEVTDDGIVRVDLGTVVGIDKGTILKVRPDRRFDDRRLRVVSSEHGICSARECSTQQYAEPLASGREVILVRVGGEGKHP
jgi:hypothetical protein